MGAHVEEFRLPMRGTESEEACHRALRSPDWEERASDLLEVPVPIPDHSSLVLLVVEMLLDLVPFTRRAVRRATTASSRAPVGPPDVDAEMYGVWQSRVVVRISLWERGAVGTDVTISGSDLGLPTDGTVRSAIRELRRSIEIQSGSLTPYRPPLSS